MTRVACIGECMIELSPAGERTLQLAYAGDVCNTAVALARLARGTEIVVQFVTRLGDERHSDAMLAEWQAEGISQLMDHQRAGKMSAVTNDVERITGKKPRTLEQFAQENRAAFT